MQLQESSHEMLRIEFLKSPGARPHKTFQKFLKSIGFRPGHHIAKPGLLNREPQSMALWRYHSF
jgi:hypothetical protein